MSQELFVFASR